MNKLKPVFTSLVIITLLSSCLTMPGSSSSPQEGWDLVGEVVVERQFWNLFFQPSPSIRQELLKAEAQNDARKAFGNEAVIEVIKIDSQWNPMSLLLVADLIGFVEDTILTAAVYLPTPPVTAEPEPEPEPEPEKVIIYHYPVSPEEGYTDSTEYTIVDFMTKEMMIQDINQLHEEGVLSENDRDEKLAELHPGGAVYVSVGRKDIDNAISKWFQFRLTKDGSEIFTKRGVEDIPYVPGSDKLWWNEILLPIKTDEAPPFEFTIVDSFQESTYVFSITKEVLNEEN